MIRLTEIVSDHDRIMCNAFVEDCKKSIKLVYDKKKQEFEPYSFPYGYEYCLDHIHHAKKYLREAMEKDEKLPKERTIMWY